MNIYQMPDGSWQGSQDGGNNAVLAWVKEALKELQEVNQRLKKIEERLDRIDLADSG